MERPVLRVSSGADTVRVSVSFRKEADAWTTSAPELEKLRDGNELR